MTEEVRFKVSAESELPIVLTQLEKLITLQGELGLKGDAVSEKMESAYKNQGIAIRDLADVAGKSYKEINSATDDHVGKVRGLAKDYDGWGNTLKTVRNQLIMAFGISELKTHIEKIFELTATYQKYQAALAVGLGNEKKAAEALEMLQTYADKTNFTLGELAETFTKFANRGLVLTQQEMVKLGDVANALQKPFEQLGEAILDVNNTERWNELGIKAKTVGEKVQLTFKGVTLEVERTEKGVLGAIVAFGNLNGVAGQTEAQAKTLAGQYSTLQDSAAGLGRTIGNAMTPAFIAAIEASGGFIKIIAGSESAFTRTSNWIKTVVAALVTYQAATRGSAAAMAAWEVIIKAKTLAMGVYNLAVIAVKGTTEGFTFAQLRAAAAVRTTWAALAANPLGAIVAAVGVATTAYYAFKAAQTEVNITVDAATEKIIKEKAELTAAVSAVQGYSIGTRERTKAVQELINKYPGMLSYMDAETVSNRQLNKALTEQVKLLDAKIKYAAAAAVAEDVAQKSLEINKEQFVIITKLRDRYKDLSESYPDNTKFLAQLRAQETSLRNVQNSSVAAAAATQGTIKPMGDVSGMLDKYNSLQKESVKIQGQMTLAVVERSKASSQNVNAEIDEVNRQIKILDLAHKQKKVNDEDYRVSRQKLLDEIKRLNGEEVNNSDDTVKKLGKGQDEKKNKAIFTAKEIAVLTKQIQQEYFKDQLALVDAQKNLEIERINHSKLTEEQAKNEILKIVEEAEAKKTAMRRKFMEYSEESYKEETLSSKDLKDAQIFDLKETEEAKKKTEKAKRDESKKTVEEWTAHQRDVQRIAKETAKIEMDARGDVLKMAFDHLSAQEGIFGQLSKIARTVYNDISLINGKTIDGYVASTMAAKKFAEEQARIYGANSEQYKKAQLDALEENKKLEEAKANALKAKMAIATMVLDLLETVKNGIVQSVIGANNAVIQSSIKIRDTMNELYDDILELNNVALDEQLNSNKEALAGELSAFKGTQEEKRRIIEDHYQRQTSLIESFYKRQKELAEAKDSINAQITFNTRMLEINTETTKKISSAWDLSKGPLGPQTLFKVLTAWKEHNAQLQAAAFQREAHEKQLAIERVQFEINEARKVRDIKIEALREEFDVYQEKINDEIDAAQTAADAKIKLKNLELDTVRETYQKEVDAVRDAYDKQVDALRQRQTAEETALRATYDLKQQLLAQSSSDEIDQLSILDRVRNDALERYRTTEVNKLIATRDRILATLTNENERAAVTAEYDRKIAAVHSQVEDAKLDKTKGVSVATTQIRNEEKEESIRLKGEEKTAIEKLQDDFQAQFKKLADDRDATLATMAATNKKREGELKDDIQKIQTELTDEIKRLKGLIDAKDAEINNKMKAANADYANAVNQANRDIFELTKKMKIAELQAEIAILKGKRNLFNRGKIDSAIDDLNAAIGDIQNLNFGGQASPPAPAPSTPNTGGGDANTNPPDPTTPSPNPVDPMTENYFQGTPYVKGLGFPDGIDTVPAMLSKGERVLPTALNEKLGPVSNEELVKSYLKMDELRTKFADIRIPEFAMLNYDAGIVPSKNPAVDLSGLEKEVRKLIDVIDSKPELSIHVDANHINVAEVGRHGQHVTYYENIFKR